jgi:transcriptional regulator with XRE-family HTH domain
MRSKMNVVHHDFGGRMRHALLFSSGGLPPIRGGSPTEQDGDAPIAEKVSEPLLHRRGRKLLHGRPQADAGLADPKRPRKLTLRAAERGDPLADSSGGFGRRWLALHGDAMMNQKHHPVNPNEHSSSDERDTTDPEVPHQSQRGVAAVVSSQARDDLRKLIKECGLSQRQLGKALKMSQGAISRFMTEDRPNSRIIIKLAGYFSYPLRGAGGDDLDEQQQIASDMAELKRLQPTAWAAEAARIRRALVNARAAQAVVEEPDKPPKRRR